ncbi:MAG: hypothetical protein ACJ8BW_00250 [Ktedonobacteraceae bacterium]
MRRGAADDTGTGTQPSGGSASGEASGLSPLIRLVTTARKYCWLM